jgi:Zn-finger nucleic acid-binding protein
MDCVSCKEPMVVLEVDQVEIDHCVNCGGVWLDAGELELLLEEADAAQRTLEGTSTNAAVHQGSRKCPICRKTMEELTIGDSTRITIDRCRQGHGIWFDKGELQGVMRIFGGDSGTKVVRLLEDIFGTRREGKED